MNNFMGIFNMRDYLKKVKLMFKKMLIYIYRGKKFMNDKTKQRKGNLLNDTGGGCVFQFSFLFYFVYCTL